ncbi:MAG: hypothetical protein DRR16_03900, partial [Candidatus Parabeggiatoa sp. nov. 3]
NTLPTLQIGGQHKHATHPTNWWAAKTRYPPYKLVGSINTLPTLQDMPYLYRQNGGQPRYPPTLFFGTSFWEF